MQNRGCVTRSGRRAEYPVENRVHMLEMIIEVEQVAQLFEREALRDFGICLEQFKQRELAVGLPHFHRVALDKRVAVFAAEPGLSEGQQNPLRMDEAAHPIEVLLHPFRIDEELVDDAG